MRLKERIDRPALMTATEDLNAALRAKGDKFIFFHPGRDEDFEFTFQLEAKYPSSAVFCFDRLECDEEIHDWLSKNGYDFRGPFVLRFQGEQFLMSFTCSVLSLLLQD